ncbi:MAG: AIPR family protein [Micrococcus sp.]|nr:AIPR family protein [Micrococcus sp.]
MTGQRRVYSDDLQDAIAHRAAGEGLFDLEAFAAVFAERLEESDELRDLTIMPLSAQGQRGKGLEVLGHGYDDADDSLIVIVGRHFGGASETLTMSDARKVFDSGRAFLEHSLNGWLQENLDFSSPEVEAAEDLVRGFNRCASVRMVLFTDGTMSNRIKNIDADELSGRDVSYAIWDVQRLADAAASSSGREPIAIDFTEWLPDGLAALVGSEEEGSGMFTYLAVLRGDILAEIFRRYGSRLLESNVRTYLGTAGKINKGIQSTLKYEASRFLAYNNGLTTTATGMRVFDDDGAIIHIASIEDWQIVNGGQTTSSLAYFLRRNPEADLSGVVVQIKLVMVEPEDARELVPNISRFANSQNKVNEADFFANSEYHQMLERISKRVMPPAQGGNQYRSGWFYERARGQWENERRALQTPARQREWDLKFPKRQRIVKTDWAKYQMTWAQKPHIASKGAQANFLAFAVEADRLWEESRSAVNEQYFREGVGKALLFGDARAAISAEPWYQERRGYLANIVAYSVSKLSYELEQRFPGRRLDFERLWKNQAAGAGAVAAVLSIAPEVLGVLTASDRPQANVTQWAKQAQCWERVRALPVKLPQSLASELVDESAWRSAQSEAKLTQRFDTGMKNVERVIGIDAGFLLQAVSSGEGAGKLTERESDIMAKIARRSIPVPSEAQAKVVLAALERLAQEALVDPGAY